MIWLRIITLIGFLNQSFPGGTFGSSGSNLVGDFSVSHITAPTLAVDGGAAPLRRVAIYRPPAHFNTTEKLPIVYFLPGYSQDPGEFARVADLMALLIFTGQVQNMYVVFLPGAGGIEGSFHVNGRVPEEQAPGTDGTSGRYQDSIVEDLIPSVENILLAGRVKS